MMDLSIKWRREDSKTTLERFEGKYIPEPNSGCWLWVGGLKHGYGQFRKTGQQNTGAHRWAYEHFVGPIPDGLVIDHRCRVRSCVNPDHMEVVTNKENILRGEAPSAYHARKTHCSWGHPLSGENLYIEPTGSRRCRVCRRRSAKRLWSER